jgi:Nop53 (60S ribosomal biogenesis)
VSSAKSLRTQVAVSLRGRLAALDARRAARIELVKRRGLIGQRLGKHRIQEGQVDVQLGEELSESLRELKVRTAIGLLFTAHRNEPDVYSHKATCSGTDSSAFNTALLSNHAFPYCACKVFMLHIILTSAPDQSVAGQGLRNTRSTRGNGLSSWCKVHSTSLALTLAAIRQLRFGTFSVEWRP